MTMFMVHTGGSLVRAIVAGLAYVSIASAKPKGKTREVEELKAEAEALGVGSPTASRSPVRSLRKKRRTPKRYGYE